MKDKNSMLENLNIVCLIECNKRGKMYMGQTSQLLKKRVVQHRIDCSVKVNAYSLTQHYHRQTKYRLMILQKERNSKTLTRLVLFILDF